MRPRTNSAFTLVEVVVAIAFMAVAVVGLIRLQLVSIKAADHARLLSRATLAADAKMAETLAADYPEPGTATGSIAEPPMQWQVTVAEECAPETGTLGLKGQRTVEVRVCWDEGIDRRQVRLVTYVADRR